MVAFGRFGLIVLWFIMVAIPARCFSIGIGVYFDNEGLVNCLPEVTSYPYFASAYIVVTECAGFGGITGWEAKLSWDANIVLTEGAISGQVINVRSFPEFLVGIGTPLPENDAVVLAQVSVVALNAGGIFLDGLGVSVPDSLPAVLFDSELDPLSIEWKYGGRESPAATIGAIPCPTLNEATGGGQLVQEEGLGSSLVYENSAIAFREEAGKSSSLLFNPNAEVAFRGVVIGVQEKCLSISREVREVHGDLGALAVEIAIEDAFLGVLPEQVVVYVLGYDVPGCTQYGNDWGFPSIADVVPGAECLVGAMVYDGDYLVAVNGSFEIINGNASGISDKSLNPFIGYSQNEQLQLAEIVVDAIYMGSNNGLLNFEVIRRIKGEPETLIAVKWSRGMRAWSNWETGKYVVRVFLNSDDASYSPIYGKHSLCILGVLK